MVAPSSSSLPPSRLIDNLGGGPSLTSSSSNDPLPPPPSSSSSNNGPPYLLPMASPMSPFVSRTHSHLLPDLRTLADSSVLSFLLTPPGRIWLPRKVTFQLVQAIPRRRRQQLRLLLQPRSGSGWIFQTFSAARTRNSSRELQGPQDGEAGGRRRSRRIHRRGEFRTGSCVSDLSSGHEGMERGALEDCLRSQARVF